MGNVFTIGGQSNSFNRVTNGLSSAEHAKREAQTGNELAAHGRFEEAAARFREAIRLQPADANIRWMKAIADAAAGEMSEAHLQLLEAVRLNPNFGFAYSTLAEWYLTQGMIEAALESSAKAMQLSPGNPGVMAARACALEIAGELDAAWMLVDQLLNHGVRSPALVRLFVRLAYKHGASDKALVLVNQVLAGRGLSRLDESALRLSAAELLDKLGRYDEAFTAVAVGNTLRHPPYDPDAQQREIDRTINYFSAEKMRSLPRAVYRSDKPVFIVGMPRSGTSLVEQIVASHPDVHGAGELDFLHELIGGVTRMLAGDGKEYPQCLDGLSIAQADGMAQVYLEPLAALNPAAKRITDKMPLNCLHLGLINVLLPGARIIHCRRDPLDTCLSCFMTFFGAGNEFKYNLTHLGRFYRDYQRLMEHWKSVIDLPMLEVDYEQLVADPESQTRRLIEFMGLEWDQRCLQFHQTRRSVATASVQQVRQPMYGSSVQRWRRYEKHLGPLRAALGV
jgi:Sulfotransferase family